MRYEFISRKGAKAQSNRRVRDAAINIVRSDKMSGVTHHSLNLTLA
jgi:hypothetical protein